MATNPFQRFARGAAATAPATVTTQRGDNRRESYDSPSALSPQPSELAAAVRKRKLVVKQESAEGVDASCEHALHIEESDDVYATDRRIKLLRQLVEARRDGPDAAIDVYGTQACVFNSGASERTKRFQILIAALLSSQTQDPITHAAMQRLHTHLQDKSSRADQDGLTIAKVRNSTVERLQELLVPVGFYRRKAQQINDVADTLHFMYKDDIPRRLHELLKLPGVGPKIARVILLLAWDDVDQGLIVDTHVHRLSQRLGWVPSPDGAKTPEATREALEEWVPREYWRDFSRNVVGFGQNVCVAVHPKCIDCPLAPLCPSAFTYQHPSKKTAGHSVAKKPKTKKNSLEVGSAVELRYEHDDICETGV